VAALREIFARFGVDFDNGPLLAGDNAVTSTVENLQGLARVVAGGALVMGIRSFAAEMTHLGDELNDTSNMLGISSTELQEWQHVARLSGVEAGEFTMAMVRLQNRMAQGGAGAQVFRHLGVDIRDANGDLRNASDVLTDLADPIAHLSTQSERTGVLMDLLGRSGARLGPLFQQGSEGIRQARAELAELGGGMSVEAVQAAGELQDANTRLDVSWLSIRSRLALFVLPAMERLVEVSTAGARALSFMSERGRILQATFVVVGAAAAAAGARSALAWAAAAVPFVGVGIAILGLILIVEDLMVAFDGGNSVFQGFADGIDEWAQQWSDPATGPISGVIQAFQFLLGIIASTYQQVAQLTGLLPSIGDDVENLAGEQGPEAALALQIAQERRAQWQASGSSTESFIPDTVEREDALRQAHAMISSGTVPDRFQAPGGGSGGAPTVTQTVRIDRIDATGLTEEAAGRMVESAISRALTAQADDTLDVAAGQ